MSQVNQDDLTIGGVTIAKGKRKQLEIPIAKLFDYTEITIPVEVIRGKEDGPILFVSAALHGDEINGVESIKRVLARKKILSKIRGTLIAVPIVNAFGYNRNIRYLPDRRDLNRCFPGSEKGSLAGQLAYTFLQEIVSKCTHGIDLHTAAIHRSNLPQIRANLDDEETLKLALNFGTPVIINAQQREGTLRKAAVELGIPMLLFEGGEALRYNEKAIKSSVKGIFSVMQSIGMIEGEVVSLKQRKKEAFIAKSSHWVRAPHSGSLRSKKRLGVKVEKGEILGVLSDPFGRNKVEVRARATGIIIGIATLPLVNNGDALFHIATFKDSDEVEDRVEAFQDDLEN